MRIIITIAAIISLQACQSTSKSDKNFCMDALGKPVTSEIAPIVRIEPRYPSNALEKSLKGHVKLTFMVKSDGSTENIKVVESAPEGIFDSASIDALKKWKYKPQCNNGNVVKELQQTTLSFNAK